jgi:hypothetical protein
VELEYDGTAWQIMSPMAVGTAVPALRGSYRGLSILRNATNPTFQLDVSWKELVLEDASGNVCVIRDPAISTRLLSILSRALDGRDSTTLGTLEAISTWYHIWAVSDGSQVAAVLSTSATAPDVSTIGTNYTYYAYLGAVYNDAGGDFVDFRQVDDTVYIAESIALNNTTVGVINTWSSVTPTTVVPTTAGFLFGSMGVGTNVAASIGISPGSSTVGALFFSSGASGIVVNTSFYACAPYEIPIITPQTFYYESGNVACTNRVSIAGWKYRRPYNG